MALDQEQTEGISNFTAALNVAFQVLKSVVNLILQIEFFSHLDSEKYVLTFV